MTKPSSKLPGAVALALVQLGLGGCIEPNAVFAFETFDELSPNKGRRFSPIVPAQEEEWSESPRHTDSIKPSGDFGIDLKVYYEDSTGRKGTVKSFHRLSVKHDGFTITSDGQITKFPLNGRMTKRFRRPRSTMMDCFTLSTSHQIALQCTIATKDQSCLGNFVWKFVVDFNPAGECTNVTTHQKGGHDCGGKKDQAAFRNISFACSRLSR